MTQFTMTEHSLLTESIQTRVRWIERLLDGIISQEDQNLRRIYQEDIVRLKALQEKLDAMMLTVHNVVPAFR